MTHLHPEALAGAYALFAAVRMIKSGGLPPEMWDAAIEAAWLGEQQALEILADWRVTGVERGRMVKWLSDAFKHNDPRYNIRSWHSDGTSARFVISSALQIAR